LLPKFQKYANDGASLAERCEYFRTRATAITSIISMGSRSTESESVFISQAKRKPRRKALILIGPVDNVLVAISDLLNVGLHL
jgi:hypothetical protein